MIVQTRQRVPRQACHRSVVSRRVRVPASKESPGQPPLEERLVRVFNDVREELIGSLRSLLGNKEDAQDVAQETFLRCWRNLEGLSSVRNLKAWIFRVALNAARDLQRSAWHRRVKPQLAPEVLPAVDPSASSLEDQELLTRVRGALKRLRPEEQEVFLLRQNGELSFEQIAQLRHRPVGTVKTQMRSALQKLRKVLNPKVRSVPEPVACGK
jgi:RNA polymerase sigma-70 factor, ECF subfamily